MAVSRRPGKHTMFISGFEVLGGAAEHKDRLVIDQFDAPQISWLSPGGASFSLDTSREHAPGPAMEVSYIEAENAVVVRNPEAGAPGPVGRSAKQMPTAVPYLIDVLGRNMQIGEVEARLGRRHRRAPTRLGPAETSPVVFCQPHGERTIGLIRKGDPHAPRRVQRRPGARRD